MGLLKVPRKKISKVLRGEALDVRVVNSSFELAIISYYLHQVFFVTNNLVLFTPSNDPEIFFLQ